MKMTARLAVPLVLLLTAAVRPAAQQPPPPQPPAQQQPQGQQQPERASQPIRSGINFVRVDVIVTDKSTNMPVMDLKPEEFSLTEDNKPQKIDQFSVVKIDDLQAQIDEPRPSTIRNDADEEREAARPDVRLFVILLDDYHVRRGNDMVVRKPLIEFIQNQLGPNDMVALMYPLTPVDDIRFTRDRNALAGAIDKFEGRKFNYQPRNSFEEQYAYYPAQTVERIRTQVTMGALKAAAIRMGGLREGRKSIIFVSEGFTSTLPPQLNDPVAAMPGMGNPNRNRPGVADPRNETQEFFDEASQLVDLQDVFQIANRQNTSIYAVDPRGLSTFEYGINEGVGMQTDRRNLERSLDTLRVLAANTDGRAIVNRNDLAAGMKQIVRDASGYYLLGYNSTQAPTDGKFHEIKVKVTRRNTEVRARKGYWAYTAEDIARATAPPKPEAPKAVTNALNAIAEPTRGRPARFWIGTARGAEGKSRVTFTWEAVPPQPGARAEDPAARVNLTATSPDGRPLFRGRIPEPGGADASSGSVNFDAPPGQLQMRIIVEGGNGQVIDSLTRELTVPDFTRVEVAIGTPRVFRGRTVREIANIKSNPDALPTADRDFSRSERLLVRFEAYAPGGATPAVSARLLNRAGQKMSEFPLQAAAGGGPVEFELPLSAFAAGDYLIELNAKSESGSAQELIAFKVGR
jgi:VWFA-related protein